MLLLIINKTNHFFSLIVPKLIQTLGLVHGRSEPVQKMCSWTISPGVNTVYGCSDGHTGKVE